MSSSQKSKETKKHHERRKVVMGLEEFAAGPKGAIRAIEQYKVRKEKSQVKKATLFRQYRKAMKKEGYELEKAPCRKRKHKETEEAANNDAEQEESPPKKQKKTRDSKRTEKQRKQQQIREEARAQMQAKQAEQKRREKQRHTRAKQLSKRTKRGQPIMKHVITDMLSKLEKNQHR